MVDLLEAYSVTDIVLFVVLLSLAIKGIVSFYDWAVGRLRQVFKKEHIKEKETENLETRFQSHEKELTKLSNIENQINYLVEYNQIHTRQWLEKQLEKYTNQGWIGTQQFFDINEQYECYKKGRGNSYAEGLMERIRALPQKSQ